jgi:mannose-1-phosphate guanylyltransferase
VSIDSGLLDSNDSVYVMNCDFGWADLGMWHSIYEGMKKGDDDNVVIGSQVLIENSRDNIIKLPSDHMGIIHGLEGFIVAEQGNVLLICKKEDSSALIRKYTSEVQIKYGEEYI